VEAGEICSATRDSSRRQYSKGCPEHRCTGTFHECVRQKGTESGFGNALGAKEKTALKGPFMPEKSSNQEKQLPRCKAGTRSQPLETMVNNGRILLKRVWNSDRKGKSREILSHGVPTHFSKKKTQKKAMGLK